MKKVLTIAFDGMDWPYVSSLIDNDLMPNFRKLMKEGVSGQLESPYPPGSYISWPSYLTGVEPGKHSLFYPILFKEDWTYEGRIFNSKDIECLTTFEILSEKGKSVCVLNQPAAFPVFEVNGYLISKAPSVNSDFTYPRQLKEELLQEIPDYTIHGKEEYGSLDLADQAIILMNTRHEAAEYLFKKYDTDFKSVVYSVLDTVSHSYWNESREMKRIYQHCDKLLGELVENFADQHYIMVISDHGFGRSKSNFHVNTWLHQLGLLKFKKDYLKIHKINTYKRKIAKFYNIYLRDIFDKISPLEEPKSESNSITLLSNIIDWSKTKVYFREDRGFRLNLLGRERLGIVTPEEGNKIFNFLELMIKKVSDPETGYKPFSGLIKSNSIYDGDFIKYSPDFFIRDSEQYNRSFDADVKRELFTYNKKSPGAHTPNGVFFIKGKGVKENKNINGMKLVDILPNLLYLFDLPSYSYFDGVFRPEIFSSSFLSKRKYTLDNLDIVADRKESSIKSEDVEKFEKFWKQVGYI